MDEKKRYAEQWEESSQFFYSNNDYFWMCNQIKQYHIVLEIGCGTGQSTLALVEQGHKVISVEKNQYCLEKAQSLIRSKGYTYEMLEGSKNDCNVIFILADICDENFSSNLSTIAFDIVILVRRYGINILLIAGSSETKPEQQAQVSSVPIRH